ncbi:MAG: hypothetical protein H7067_17010, partial [Burkholderiales bacterium]|nr:hypothetical protein [Opitutaceae bacterium]
LDCLVALLAAFATASAVHAQASTTITWEGNASTNVLDAGNWVGGLAPVNSTGLIFGAAGTAGSTLSLGTSLNTGYSGTTQPAITFTTAAPAYIFDGAGTLTVATGGLRNESGKLQTFNNPFRFNTGSQHPLANAGSALLFANTTTLNANTTILLGSATNQAVTFGGNILLGGAGPWNLTLTGGGNSSTVNLNGASSPGLQGNLSVGQNVRLNLGSATALSAAAKLTLNGGGATLANTSGSVFTSSASLAFNAASQSYTFGAIDHTAANNLVFAGSAAIDADQTRSLTLAGTGLTVSSASVWNNTVTGNRSLTVNGAGNTLTLGGIAVGASGETANVVFTANGAGSITLSGGVTVGLGTGTRGLQYNGAGTFAINGASNYTGSTGVGGSGTVLVNGTHTGGGSYSVGGTLGGAGSIDLSANNANVGFTSTGANRRLLASSADGLAIIGGASTALNLTNAAGRTDTFQSFYFTLATPGSTVVDVQGALNLGAGTLEFNDFAFTPGPGFGGGVYRLFDYVSATGTLGASLAGTVGGLPATISQDATNGAIILTVVSETNTPLEDWRDIHFNTTEATGSAADDADPDFDGVPNLIEYALGTTPTDAASVALPTTSVSANNLQLTFNRARSDVTYIVEATSSLATPTTWTPIATNPGTVGASVTVTDTVDLSTAIPARRFLRLSISNP